MKPVEILIKAKDQASGVFDSFKGKVTAVAAAVAGLFGFSMFASAIRGAADLQAKLSEVKAVSGATAEEMKALRAAAEEAGATTKFTATEAADALGNLARAGLLAKQAIVALPPVLQLAQAGKMELASAAEIVTKTLAGFVLEADQAGRVVDVLAKAADSSNTDVRGLAQALSYAAPVAKSLGLELEFTVALLGKFADAGIDASRGGTALNAILSQFSDPASRFRQELAAMGITTSNFEQALREMAKAGPGAQKAVLAVGTEAGPALRALLNQGIGSLDDLTGKLRQAQGAAAATAAVMEDNLVGAANGLSSAWDSVKNALATPILPVLKQGVEQLSGALQAAVSDGTVTKFGESIATAFQAGLTWAKAFFGQVDFEDLGRRMRAFAAEAGQTFQLIGDYARNTGNILQVAYGVMSAGANAVLIPVYGIGAAFARVVEDIFNGIALIREGFAKVTFGGLSQAVKQAAAEAREEAGAFGAAAEAMEKKAVSSFEAMAEGAQTARKGWDGLTSDMKAADSQAARSAQVLDSTAEQLKTMGAASSDAGKKAVDAAVAQRKSVEETNAAVTKLRNEYQQAINTGNLQLAIEKQRELTAATNGATAAAAAGAQTQAQAAQAIADAFERAGIQTKDSLKTIANTALQDFEVIKASGQATTDGLRAAWQRYAEAAIAANGGVASELLKTQASMRGLEISTDSTGKAIVRAMDSGTQAASGLGNAVQMTTEQIYAQEDAMDRIAMKYMQSSQYTERQIALLERENELMERRDELERKRLGVDREGFSTDKSGNTLAAGGDLTTLTGIAAFLKAAGVADENRARAIAREFSDSKGDIPYFDNPGQIKYGGRNSTMSQAVLKAAERETFGVGAAAAGAATSIPRQTRTINLQVNGKSHGTVDLSDAQANTLENYLAELERAAGLLQ